MEEQTRLDDSGERISYGDGMAIREPSTGKGRYENLLFPVNLLWRK